MTLRRFTGSAAEFHGRSIGSPSDVEVWSFTVEHTAIVLGPRQTEAVLNGDACRAAGVEIATRRSGGGVVLLEPDAVEWVDIVVPPTSPWWIDDVVESLVRCGDVWRAAFADLGDGDLDVYTGRLRRDPLADLVCFAGLGAGEITDAAGAKLLGLSQRRTRDGARLQCIVHHRWNAELLHGLLAPGLTSVEEIRAIPVTTVEAAIGRVSSAAIVDAVHAAVRATAGCA